MWEYFDIDADTPYERVLAEETMPGARWFPGGGPGRRAGRHPPDAVDAAVLLERPGGHPLPRRLLLLLSGRVAARRLDHCHGPRLGDRPRPLRQHPEPQRCRPVRTAPPR
ncbi:MULTISPECIES: hypothetical protein [Streptomyces]|uniref:hypothetical protein n=1 Tax=Streptomyces TaxID=1883 RepID=UPI00386935E2